MNDEFGEKLLGGLQVVEHGVLRPTYEHLEVRLDRTGKLEAATVTRGLVTTGRTEIPFLLHPGFAVHRLEVDKALARDARDGPVLHYARPARSVGREERCTIGTRYSGYYTLGVRSTSAGDPWYEFNLIALWRPLFSLDLRHGAQFEVAASLPGRLRVVSSIAKGEVRSTDDGTTGQWDTRRRTSVDFSFVAGPGEYAESWSGGMRFAALTMRGAPYQPQDVAALAREIVELYGSLWGACPFDQLIVACPPGSVSGNCAREGLVIAGLIGDRDLASGLGLLAHEIAHLWWGIGIRFDPTRPGCEEGLAEYASLVAKRARLGRQTLRKIVTEDYLPQAKDAETHGTALLDCTLFQPYSEALRQRKGACAFLLLERAMGEEAMARALREFASRFRGRAATPDDLRAALVACGGPDVAALWDAYVAGIKPLPDTSERYVG